MERKISTYLGLCAATVGTSLGFMYPAFSPTRTLWYYPLQHRFTWELKPAGLAMDWYGRSLVALLLGALAFVVTWVASRFVARVSRRSLYLWASWVATGTLLAIALYVYQLVTREPVPEPLPSWYVPK